MIRVTIAPDGTPTVEVFGVKGDACMELTAPILRSLGNDGSSEVHVTLKDEFYEQEQTSNSDFA